MNGYQENLIDFYPFKNFKLKNIENWWCKINIIPINIHVLYNEKARHQLGSEKSVLGEYGKKLIARVNDYKKEVSEIYANGF